MAASIADSLDFFEAMSGSRVHEASRAPFYASHEALHLLYEQAQTRFIPRSGRWYNLSTHLPWIGMRTADLGGAHVEYCRGISNPVGVKIGPAMHPAWVQGLCHVLNPNKEPGRLVLIHRMGAKHVEEKLPGLVEIRARDGRAGALGMRPDARQHGDHGVGRQDAAVRQYPLRARGGLPHAPGARQHLGGVHFELTGENVTECLGGASGLMEADLDTDYRSQVDPRLNYEQALELAMRIATVARSA